MYVHPNRDASPAPSFCFLTFIHFNSTFVVCRLKSPAKRKLESLLGSCRRLRCTYTPALASWLVAFGVYVHLKRRFEIFACGWFCGVYVHWRGRVFGDLFRSFFHFFFFLFAASRPLLRRRSPGFRRHQTSPQPPAFRQRRRLVCRHELAS